MTPFARRLAGVFLLAVHLTLLTVGVYFPVVRFDFVHWDDDAYVLNNARVQAGVTADNYDYPLTWLSRMLFNVLLLFAALFGVHRRARGPSTGRYLFVFAAFLLGLLIKPMIVTLP